VTLFVEVMTDPVIDEFGDLPEEPRLLDDGRPSVEVDGVTTVPSCLAPWLPQGVGPAGGEFALLLGHLHHVTLSASWLIGLS
jgi:hypothetical protein